MSIQAIGWVLAHSDAEHGARLVHIALANYAGPDGAGAWPSISTLARDTRLSPRAVQYALRKLEDAGYIVDVGATERGTTVWNLRDPRGAKSAGPGIDDCAGMQSAQEGVQSATAAESHFAPDPLREPSLTGTPPHPLMEGELLEGVR